MMDTFRNIQNQAKQYWESLYHGEIPHILVGTASCGRAAGALAVVEAIKKELARQNAQGNSVRSWLYGALLPGATGYHNQARRFYRLLYNVTPQVVPTLVEGYVVGDDPCLDLALGTVEGGEGKAVYIPELSRFEHEYRLLLRQLRLYQTWERLKHYIANGGYSSLVKALKMRPAEIIE